LCRPHIALIAVGHDTEEVSQVAVHGHLPRSSQAIFNPIPGNQPLFPSIYQGVADLLILPPVVFYDLSGNELIVYLAHGHRVLSRQHLYRHLQQFQGFGVFPPLYL
jgi:hypothetical protein